jgi:uncharacterized protein (UPF0548 family)
MRRSDRVGRRRAPSGVAKLAALTALEPTYPEVGATRATLLGTDPFGRERFGTASANGASASRVSVASGGSVAGAVTRAGSPPHVSAGGARSGAAANGTRAPAGAAGPPAGDAPPGMSRDAARPAAVAGPGGCAPLPPGYHHLRYRRRVGHGTADFHVAAGLLHAWRMHRAAGASVEATGPAVEGAISVVRLAGLRAPCRVVWSVPVVESDTGGVAGFGYGTLPGHPERGEEGFLVTLSAAGDVWFDLAAFSVAATWPARAAGPVGRLAQRLFARRCGYVLARAVRRSR